MRFVPVCPEVGIGLGVPRDRLGLVQRLGEARLIGGGGADHTERMRGWALATAARLRELDLSGFVLNYARAASRVDMELWDGLMITPLRAAP